METKIIALAAFHVIGYRIEATVEEFEGGLRERYYHKLLARKNDIKHRKMTRFS